MVQCKGKMAWWSRPAALSRIISSDAWTLSELTDISHKLANVSICFLSFILYITLRVDRTDSGKIVYAAD